MAVPGFFLATHGGLGGTETYFGGLIKAVPNDGIYCRSPANGYPKGNGVHLYRQVTTAILWAMGRHMRPIEKRRRTRPYTISTVHGGVRSKKWTQQYIKAEKPDKIVCVSQEAKSVVPSNYQNKSVVIYNSINTDRLQPTMSKADAREKYGIPDDKKILLYLGRINKDKGIHNILPVLSLMGSDWILVMVGAVYPETQEYANSLTQHSQVIHIPPLSEVGDVIQLADRSISLSRQEGFGYSVLETMYMGVPTVTFNVGIIPEIPGIRILPWKPTSHQIAEQILDGHLSTDIKQLIEKKFSHEDFIEQWKQLLV